ncbi:hypothetical protein N657DRAFT_641157 [Parathielavia appendiculata]|uniref:Secreted protein n=1 Tax=Parathielavia appendiculata TaxID=2587402 RepID=A0AAN6U718_9PEZI|nr:hypothetical protein N657DRAFT_641157 [Parathielavia appendiculata]
MKGRTRLSLLLLLAELSRVGGPSRSGSNKQATFSEALRTRAAFTRSLGGPASRSDQVRFWVVEFATVTYSKPLTLCASKMGPAKHQEGW